MNILINSKIHKYPDHYTLQDISRDFKDCFKSAIIAAKVDNELFHLTKVPEDCSCIEFLDSSNVDGWKINNRTLSYIFIKSCKDLFPNSEIAIKHSFNKGLFCDINFPDGRTLEETDVFEIRKAMRNLIARDVPLVKKELSIEEAVSLFNELGRTSKANLLRSIDKKHYTVYYCEDYVDCFYGLLAPSTGCISLFDVHKIPNKNSVVLLGVDRRNNNVLTQYQHSPKLLEVYEKRRKWAEIMGVHLLGDLNQKIKNNESNEVVLMSEAIHENEISKIANTISRTNVPRLILIAGPSSSGKTSFSKRLQLQLKVNGLKPITLSTDDYFINRDKTPRDENGQLDYESIECIDMQKFNADLLDLLSGKEVEMPTYDFKLGERTYLGNKLMLGKDQPIIIEGIHSLNPQLTELIDDSLKYKIYVSPLTQLNVDNHNRICTTDVRLIRRIVRDHQFRNHSASDTINMWESVKRGENKNIYPYQENANTMFNTSLTYEISVLKKYIVPLLLEVEKGTPAYSEAKRLLGLLQYFNDIEDESCIPPTSLIQEFIGGSCLL